MSKDKPRYKSRPTGTSSAPAMQRLAIGRFPDSREHVDLSTRIDWRWVKRNVEDGYAIAFAVDLEDTQALIDTIYNRVGANIVTRWADDGVLWLCAAWALGFPAEKVSG